MSVEVEDRRRVKYRYPAGVAARYQRLRTSAGSSVKWDASNQLLARGYWKVVAVRRAAPRRSRTGCGRRDRGPARRGSSRPAATAFEHLLQPRRLGRRRIALRRQAEHDGPGNVGVRGALADRVDGLTGLVPGVGEDDHRDAIVDIAADHRRVAGDRRAPVRAEAVAVEAIHEPAEAVADGASIAAAPASPSPRRLPAFSSRPLVSAMSHAAKSSTLIITPPLGAITPAAASRHAGSRRP